MAIPAGHRDGVADAVQVWPSTSRVQPPPYDALDRHNRSQPHGNGFGLFARFRRPAPSVLLLCRTAGSRLSEQAGCCARRLRARTAELLHIDTKQLGRIWEPGKRVLGPDARRPHRNRRIGWQQLHVAIDDHSRIAHAELLAGRGAESCSRFLERSVRWFADHGIEVARALTDNAKPHHARAWTYARSCRLVQRRFARSTAIWKTQLSVRLGDLKRSRARGGSRYVGTLTDSAGETHYELGISGPARLIQKVLAESDFEHWIEPKATEKDWPSRSRKLWTTYAGKDAGARELETIGALEKSVPAAPTSKNSIVVSVRRTEGEGTLWGAWWPLLALPAGANLFFVLPPICNCFGFVVPASGDPDLFLTANGPFTPTIAFSMLGPGSIDSVSFGPPICWPWTEFMPWFRVNAFTTCAFGFGMSGFGVVP